MAQVMLGSRVEVQLDSGEVEEVALIEERLSKHLGPHGQGPFLLPGETLTEVAKLLLALRHFEERSVSVPSVRTIESRAKHARSLIDLGGLAPELEESLAPLADIDQQRTIRKQALGVYNGFCDVLLRELWRVLTSGRLRKSNNPLSSNEALALVSTVLRLAKSTVFFSEESFRKRKTRHESALADSRGRECPLSTFIVAFGCG